MVLLFQKKTLRFQHGPRYNWTQHDQSLVLGSYFWGYLLTSLPGGYLAETYGGRHVVGVAMIISVFCTCAVPVLSQWGLAWVIAARTVTGAAAGPIYPCLHFLISRWAPPDEKGKFIAALMGGTFGTVLTWSIVGILIEKAGWDYAFYVPALIAIVMTICWYGLVYDTPKDHPRILKEERDYIENVLGESFSQKKVRWLWAPMVILVNALLFSLFRFRKSHPMVRSLHRFRFWRCWCCTTVTCGVSTSSLLQLRSS